MVAKLQWFIWFGFRQWKLLTGFLIKVCYLRCVWWVITGLDNGLAPNRQQNIISTNDDSVQRHSYAARGEMSLNIELYSRTVLWFKLTSISYTHRKTRISNYMCLILRDACTYPHPDVANNILLCICLWRSVKSSQIARIMGPTWGPPGSCRPQVGPM